MVRRVVNVLGNPRLRLFIGAALISLSPVWVRLTDVSSTSSGLYRVLIGGIALVLFLLATGKRLQFAKRTWWVLVLASFFLTLDLWFWHRSINLIGPGLSTLLANFQVFIMMIVGIVFLQQMPTRTQWVAVPLALIGLTLIVGFDWNDLPANYRLGVIYGFSTAVVYAAYLLFLRQARQRSSFRMPSREMAVVSMMSAAMMAAIMMAEGDSFAIPSWQDAGWLICYGVLSHCVGWLFIASSLSEVTTVAAGLALLLQPTLSFVWDVAFFGRSLTPLELLGASIALLAIYLGSRSEQAQRAG